MLACMATMNEGTKQHQANKYPNRSPFSYSTKKKLTGFLMDQDLINGLS